MAMAMAMTINRKIWNWFDAGTVREALVGHGEFFLPDNTYIDEHNYILVVDQLFDWAKHHDTEAEAAGSVENVIIAEASAREFASASRLLLTYLLVKEDRGDTIGVDLEHVAKSLATAIKQDPGNIIDDEQTRALVLAVANRLPYFKNLLNLR
jgi:hypothetical protein